MEFQLGNLVSNHENISQDSKSITEIFPTPPCAQSTENIVDDFVNPSAERDELAQPITPKQANVDALLELLKRSDIAEIQTACKNAGLNILWVDDDEDDKDKARGVSRKFVFENTPQRLAKKSAPTSSPRTESKRNSTKYRVQHKVDFLRNLRATKLRHLGAFVNKMDVRWEHGQESFCYHMWRLFYENNWDISVANKLISKKYKIPVDHSDDNLMLLESYMEALYEHSLEQRKGEEVFPKSLQLFNIMLDGEGERNQVANIVSKVLDIKEEMRMPLDVVGANEGTPKSVVHWLLKQLLRRVHPDKVVDAPQDFQTKSIQCIKLQF